MVVRGLVAVMALAVSGCSVPVTGAPVSAAGPDRPAATTTPAPTETSRNRPSGPGTSRNVPSTQSSAPSEVEKTVLALAQTYVDAMNRQDDAAVAACTCTGGSPSLHQIAYPGATFAVEPPVEWNEPIESGQVPLLVDGSPNTPLVIRLKDGKYCVHG